jgi:hypothetical protein
LSDLLIKQGIYISIPVLYSKMGDRCKTIGMKSLFESNLGGARVALRALLLGGLIVLQTGSAESAFTPSCIMVSNPAVTMADVEFDQLYFRAVWQGPQSARGYPLYVANVDPETGDLTNPDTGFPLTQGDGSGTLVDTYLLPQREIRNGPEWAEAAPLAWGSQILYSKLLSPTTGFGIGRAKFDGTKWVTESGGILPGTENRDLPIGSESPSDMKPLMAYLRQLDSGASVAEVREINDASTEVAIPAISFTGARFMPDKRILTGLGSVDGARQLFQFDFHGKRLRQLTNQTSSDPALDKCRPWTAPEVGYDILIVCRVGTALVRIYRKPASETQSLWETYYEFSSPSPNDKPVLDEPRPFVFRGRSYIVVIAQTDTAEQFSDVWIVRMPPANKPPKRITEVFPGSLKRDTEPFVLRDHPIVYYTQYEYNPTLSSIWRCETGLSRDG